jgi:hypothetical protein
MGDDIERSKRDGTNYLRRAEATQAHNPCEAGHIDFLPGKSS